MEGRLMRIVYKDDNGGVSIVIPVLTATNPTTGKPFTIDEVAAKDVPTGKKYKKIEDSDVSNDRSFRNAWTVDESDLTDGVGA
tara:strand:- start:256 stop:504 length:249 start_codon:yes stop_codon:yes gene_type:complete